MESRAGVTACAVASATDPPPQQPPPQRPPHMRPGGVVPRQGRGPSGWTRHKLLISHHKGAYCSAQPGSRVFSRCWCGSEPQTQGWRPPGHRARMWEVPKLTSVCGTQICLFLDSKGPEIGVLISYPQRLGKEEHRGTWWGLPHRGEKQRY